MSRSAVKTWHELAVCRRETPGVPVWTSDKQPRKPVLVHIEQMCDRCPVKVQCAVQALEDREEAAIYAGVHIPVKSSLEQWHAARAKLERICGAGAGVAADGLEAVSA